MENEIIGYAITLEDNTIFRWCIKYCSEQFAESKNYYTEQTTTNKAKTITAIHTHDKIGHFDLCLSCYRTFKDIARESK